MTVVRMVFDGEVGVHYGQCYVESGDDPPWGDLAACFGGQRNGLAGAKVPGFVWLITGLHTGEVALTVQVHGDAPDLDDRWEEVVEVAFHPGHRPAALVG